MPNSIPQKSIVLVVGAGASKEARLPLGSELTELIARALDFRFDESQKIGGDNLIEAAFRSMAAEVDRQRPNLRPYMEASWRIRNAMPQASSIDNFIDSHREDQMIATCGKLAIARCILQAEAASLLKVDRGNIKNKLDFKAVQGTWFNAFFRLLTESCQQKELSDRLSKIAIVCFNYDRCIEHYVHSALQNYYGMNEQQATAAMESFEIHHPYGTVGKLPWQDARAGINFGEEPHFRKLMALAGELRTFTEGTDVRTSDISAIRDTLVTAERVVFLGFAFHRLNLALLFPDVPKVVDRRVCRIFATAFDISDEDAKAITREVSDLVGIRSEGIYVRNDLTCSALLREFRRTLSIQ